MTGKKQEEKQIIAVLIVPLVGGKGISLDFITVVLLDAR